MNEKNKKTGEELGKVITVWITFLVLATITALWFKWFFMGFVFR